VNFTDILNEMVQDELERLRNAGRELVDRLDAGPYKIFLLKNAFTYGSDYDIALTSDEEDFTSTYSQRDRKIGREMQDIARNWKRISNKVRQWTIEYGPVRVGSMNPRKTQKYRNILASIGLNVGEVQNQLGGTAFMVYPNTPNELDSN
jgi:hypothetical protein